MQTLLIIIIQLKRKMIPAISAQGWRIIKRNSYYYLAWNISKCFFDQLMNEHSTQNRHSLRPLPLCKSKIFTYSIVLFGCDFLLPDAHLFN